MIRLLQVVALALALIASGGAVAVETPRNTPAEIQVLLATLAQSGCEFNRNGTWYTGEKARQHLLRKLQYLEQRGAVKNTEQFIELAATESSSSGRPYSVRCGSASPVASKDWLLKSLNTLRSSPKGKDTLQ